MYGELFFQFIVCNKISPYICRLYVFVLISVDLYMEADNSCYLFKIHSDFRVNLYTNFVLIMNYNYYWVSLNILYTLYFELIFLCGEGCNLLIIIIYSCRFVVWCLSPLWIVHVALNKNNWMMWQTLLSIA